MAAVLAAAAALAAQPAPGKPVHKSVPRRVEAPVVPTARPLTKSGAAPGEGPPMDLSHALPAGSLAELPSSAEQLKSLTSKLAEGAPDLAAAREKSAALSDEAAALRKKLIATAARIESLEREAMEDGARIAVLTARYDSLAAGFRRDRISVTKLLAVLERLQHDMPPALALRPGDALGAARGAMLVGASLPPVYARAAALSRRIDALVRTKTALEGRRRDAAETAARLTAARADLDQLLARKEKEAAGAADRYGTLQTRLVAIARQAADFEALLKRVRALRQGAPAPGEASVVTVRAENGDTFGGLARNSLLVPVVGTLEPAARAADPGLTYATAASAQVIAPADGKVLFAGPYHKAGQVLILEITTGYDLVLAGLGRVTVKPGDQLLAGEPVGTMSADGQEAGRLYFELRRGGKGQSPVPWLRAELRKADGT